jgi:hypothetical protein
LCLNKGVIDLRTGAESVEFVSFYGCEFCKWFFWEKNFNFVKNLLHNLEAKVWGRKLKICFVNVFKVFKEYDISV